MYCTFNLVYVCNDSEWQVITMTACAFRVGLSFHLLANVIEFHQTLNDNLSSNFCKVGTRPSIIG
jgi:hypothetical protein